MSKHRLQSPPGRRLGGATWGLPFVVACALALLAGCLPWRHPAGIGEAISWDALPGWGQEQVAEAWPALLSSCPTLEKGDTRWNVICAEALALTPSDSSLPEASLPAASAPDAEVARAFFEQYLVPHVVYGEKGTTEGLVTGYYEPLLFGSRTPDDRYRYPIYGRPSDLLVIDLAELYPALEGRRVRGRLDGNRVVPYPSRAEIEAGGLAVEAEPLVYVDDPVALFFLHIQGSGRIQLPSGESMSVGYADQNGHPYRAIGRELIQSGALTREEVSLQSIRDWLRQNPDRADAILNANPSYVFFESRPDSEPGPVGTLGIPLHPERSVAVDPERVPLGSVLWLDTTLPDESETPYRRLVFAQDTGGAIRGQIRADVFFGFGGRAEDLAGRMKQPGALYLIQPRALR